MRLPKIDERLKVYRAGQEITFNVLRGKERVKVRLKLPE